MSATPDQMQSLPDDIAALRALVLATMAERDAVTKAICEAIPALVCHA